MKYELQRYIYRSIRLKVKQEVIHVNSPSASTSELRYFSTRMEKYRNPLVAEGKSVSPMIQNIKKKIKLLIFIVNICQKEIGKNSHGII